MRSLCAMVLLAASGAVAQDAPHYALTLAGAAIASSLLFFVVVDFGIWLMGDMYPRTFAGLVACYTAALPFYRNQVAGDLLFTAVLFGAYALALTIKTRRPLTLAV